MTGEVNLEFKRIDPQREETLALVSLNRPQAANALNVGMLERLTEAFEKIVAAPRCRVTILRAAGKHFCAGADLQWMRDSATMDYQANVEDAKKLTTMFEAFYNLPMPTVAVVHGAAYGGAVGLLAASDIVIARNDAKICLSEVKIGLIPAVIVPYVARRFSYGSLRRYGLSGQVLLADKALELGIIDCVAGAKDLEQTLHREINALLAASPNAQRRFKKLCADLLVKGYPQDQQTAEAIAACRTSREGQSGLTAFFNKSQPEWNQKLADDWTCEP